MPPPTTPTIIPPIKTLPSLPPSSHTTLLTTLFEPSPHLLPLLSPFLLTPHPSYTDLISATIRTRLHALVASADTSTDDSEVLDSVLSSHPRLGAPKEEVGGLSGAEQGGLRGGGGGEEELQRLNAEYEERFGGLRYVVFVNGRGRDVIMEDMRRRIERGDVRVERGEAVDAMCDIALDRVMKLSGERLDV